MRVKQKRERRARKEANLRMKRKKTMDIIPEDNEFYSTDVKYKFEFD